MRRTALMFVLAGLVGALVAVPIAVYASHQFIDVSNTNPFHADIDWLADAGVTKGCSPTEYCPKDNVTREQMAAFMRRLSGNDPGVAPSVNANQVGGFTALQLGSRAEFLTTTDASIVQGKSSLAPSITTPAPGILLLSGTAQASNYTNGADDFGDFVFCYFTVDGVQTTAFSEGVKGESEACTATAAVPVGPGNPVVEFLIDGIDPGTDLGAASTWVMWVPFNGAGIPPNVP